MHLLQEGKRGPRAPESPAPGAASDPVTAPSVSLLLSLGTCTCSQVLGTTSKWACCKGCLPWQRLRAPKMRIRESKRPLRNLNSLSTFMEKCKKAVEGRCSLGGSKTLWKTGWNKERTELGLHGEELAAGQFHGPAVFSSLCSQDVGWVCCFFKSSFVFSEVLEQKVEWFFLKKKKKERAFCLRRQSAEFEPPFHLPARSCVPRLHVFSYREKRNQLCILHRHEHFLFSSKAAQRIWDWETRLHVHIHAHLCFACALSAAPSA